MPLARLRRGRGNGFSFWVHLSHLFPPVQHVTTASTMRPHALAAQKKWLRLTLGFLEVPLGFWGIPRLVGLPPPCILGPVGMRVACLLHLHSAFCAFGACMHCAAVGSRPLDRRLETPPPFFIMARVSTKFLLRPPYTRLWDRIPRVLWDTLADESFSPRQRNGELLVLICLQKRKLGGEPAIRFAQLLELSGIPVGQDDQVVPTDYFNGLAASAAGRLPQPLSAADLADLWDSLWFLLLATADGKPSENFSPLENEWDRQDQWRWFSRDDPPPLQQPELLKWRHWRPGKIREMEPTTQRALELHMRGKWAERLLAHAYMQDILGEDFRKEALDLLGQ